MAGQQKKATIKDLHDALGQLYELKRRNQLEWYEPVPKQAEFHKAGATYRQRMLMAGNQTGKTLSAGMEVAMHLTGWYPDWWNGRRWDRPTHWWVSGVTGESTRDNPQRILLGRKREWGTGAIPWDAYVQQPMMSRGIPDAVNNVQVLHRTGGISTVTFKSYDQGREKWQGETLDGIWYDEEPPTEIYEEGLTRLNRNRGSAILTFTPLMGMTEVVSRFLEPDTKDPGRFQRHVTHMTLEDATFYSSEEREEIEAQYTPAMRRARVQGLPLFGEGLIYPFQPEQITTEPFEIPSYFKRIVGLDHGINHPTALVWVAYDADQDVAYVYDCWKQSNTTLADRVQVYRQKGDWIPVAWPHDVAQRDAGNTGQPIAELYEQYGMKMLPRSARIDPDRGGPQPREPIIQYVYDRLNQGRLKIFSHLKPLISEQQRYHRKDGQVVAENDDLISAMHYAIMELRSARPSEDQRDLRPAAVGVDHDPLAGYPL